MLKKLTMAGLVLTFCFGAQNTQADSGRKFKNCKSDIKLYINKLKKGRTSYIDTVYRWKKRCLQDRELKRKRKYRDLKDLYKKANRLAEDLERDYRKPVKTRKRRDRPSWKKKRVEPSRRKHKRRRPSLRESR